MQRAGAVIEAVAVILACGLSACGRGDTIGVAHAAAQQMAAAPADIGTGGDSVTHAQMRNVHFHVAHEIVLQIRELEGDMRATGADASIVFDDIESFELQIGRAEIALSTESLANMMNDYVFAYDGAPLRDLEFELQEQRLVQKGVLHKVIDIPFEITATPSVTADGQIRIHPERTEILGVDGTGLMKALGIELEDLLDLSKAKGVRVRGNDMYLDPELILPPPRISGRLAGIRVEADALVQSFDDGATGRPSQSPPESATNYMFFTGGTLGFGKLYMVDADMSVIDLDPADPFDFSIGEYHRQLVAGYSRTQGDRGLEVFMPDLDDLGATSTASGTRTEPPARVPSPSPSK